MKRRFFGLALGVSAALAAGVPTTPMAKDNVITLVSAISFTGKYAKNGVHAKNGYDLAVKVINEKGGVKVGGKSYQLAINYYDDESTPARAAQLLERLIAEDGIKYVLGPYSSATTKAAALITEKYKIPMIEAQGPSHSLFGQGFKYLFAVLSTSEQYLASAIDLAAQLAEQHGKSLSDVKVAMAFENDSFSREVRSGVLDKAKQYGMTIVIDDKLPKDLSDMAPTLTKARALKPDVLVVSGHSEGAATAARQISEMKIDVPIIAMTHCEAAGIVDKFADAVNGILCPTQWAKTLSYKDGLFGTAADYDRLFKETFADYKHVPYQSAQASAAVMVWADAFERANSLDTQAVRDAIAATDLDTFYGKIKFSEAGNNIAKPMVLRQIQDGQYNAVAPVEWASHEVDYLRQVD